MEKPVIAQKAPYIIDMDKGSYHWCACGKSSKQPFCDGSHKGSEFTPKKVEVTEFKKIAWCGCKHTKNEAFCDGSHRAL
jgi:CDGSH-type Zn-finger protein